MEHSAKIAVISGASSGLGLALANKMTEQGYTVVDLSRSGTGENCVKCDVTDPLQITAAAEQIKKLYGKIDILVNNAGIGLSGALETADIDHIARVTDISYFGALNLTRACLPMMGKGSRIIFVSSACALFALPYRSAYCAAKAAMSMLARGFYMELKSSGIHVIEVCPGDIKTEFTQNRLKDFTTNERYGDKIKDSTQKLDSRQDKRMPVGYASDKLYRIAVKKKKAFYIIGNKYKFLYFLKKIIPHTAFLKLTAKFFG